MEERFVNVKEIDGLLEKSKQESHPYYYRFSYKLRRGILATRIRKGELTSLHKRIMFHQAQIDEKSAIGKALSRIEKAKRKIEKAV